MRLLGFVTAVSIWRFFYYMFASVESISLAYALPTLMSGASQGGAAQLGQVCTYGSARSDLLTNTPPSPP